ncbi:hypothetical protein H181DRAFT_03453 [Streptomyces sp. WMMB 714]|nr:hypothetical protein H181DRAFT_03453 [Streptomyces sp. WMMB 714]
MSDLWDEYNVAAAQALGTRGHLFPHDAAAVPPRPPRPGTARYGSALGAAGDHLPRSLSISSSWDRVSGP